MWNNKKQSTVDCLKYLIDVWFLCKTNFAVFSFCRDYSLVGKSRNPIC